VNLSYYQALMSAMRLAIAESRLGDFAGEAREGWAGGEAAQ
jgi:queuine/archaeosine tRNA-ribosyltransferase